VREREQRYFRIMKRWAIVSLIGISIIVLAIIVINSIYGWRI
jgi:hypothetical protein